MQCLNSVGVLTKSFHSQHTTACFCVRFKRLCTIIVPTYAKVLRHPGKMEDVHVTRIAALFTSFEFWSD